MKYVLLAIWMAGHPPSHSWEWVEEPARTAREACDLYRALVAARGEPWTYVVMILDTPGSASRGLTGVTCGRRA